jgi:hypothetical protein
MYENIEYSNIFVNNFNNVGRSVKQRNEGGG